MQKILLNSSSIWYGLDNIKKQASAMLCVRFSFLVTIKKKNNTETHQLLKKHNKNKINNLLKNSK